MPIFNQDRKYDNKIQKYPLFFGPELSLKDAVDVTYPEIEELIFVQRSQFWHEKTVNMTVDRVQFPTLPKHIQDISVLNLAWQSQADSIAGRAPLAALMPFVSNPELEELLNYWQLFEQIHSRTYQEIIKTVFPDPAAVRNEVANLEEAMDRLETVVDTFDELESMAALYTLSNGKKAKELNIDSIIDIDANEEVILTQIFKALAALYAMESIQFMTSFACTFALSNQKVLTATTDQVRKIAKDEMLHVKFTKTIISILSKCEIFGPIVERNKPFMKKVMDEVVEAEKKWAKFLFSEGRQVIGLNEQITIEYIDYLSTKAYEDVGLVYDNPNTKHPIPWVEKYLDPSKVQVAPQERDVTNYTVGSVKNDLAEPETTELNELDADDFLDVDLFSDEIK